MEGGLISFMMPAKSIISTGMALRMRPVHSLPFDTGASCAADCIGVASLFFCFPTVQTIARLQNRQVSKTLTALFVENLLPTTASGVRRRAKAAAESSPALASVSGLRRVLAHDSLPSPQLPSMALPSVRD